MQGDSTQITEVRQKSAPGTVVQALPIELQLLAGFDQATLVDQTIHRQLQVACQADKAAATVIDVTRGQADAARAEGARLVVQTALTQIEFSVAATGGDVALLVL
ncbi:hypothetical protein D3C84_833360 [compost metagenome]